MKLYPFKSMYLGFLVMALILSFKVSAGEVLDELAEARVEGQIFMAYALNKHLSSFDLDIEVNQSEATISGKVEEDVQKDLAEEVALSLNGIDSVDNQIEVTGKATASRRADGSDRNFGDRISDATTTATVKSKLLWNGNTGGLAINVSTENGHVFLDGESDSESSKALAERLAANTDGVLSVNNRISVIDDSDSASDDSRGVDDIASDSWITTKVRSSLIFTASVPARSIGIETTDGVVKLDGEVENPAARDLAIEITSGIRGVREVDADNLRVVGEGA